MSTSDPLSIDSVDFDLVRNAPRSEEDLLNLLRDGLDWPLAEEPEDLDTSLLEWEPQELGIDPDSVARLKRIRQVRPQTSSDRFGVFLLETEKGEMPIGALRRLLDQIIRRNRKRKSGAPVQFDMDDILFVISGNGKRREVHFAVFHDEPDRQPTLRVLSWGEGSTDERIVRLADAQLGRLRWPDAEVDLDQWRSTWREAFRYPALYAVKTAEQLAKEMAAVARDLRDEISAMLAIETESGPTRELMRHLREQLVPDLDEDDFAVRYAETMVYGLLASRIAAASAGETVAPDWNKQPFENVLLDAIYAQFSEGTDGLADLDHLGLSDLRQHLEVIDVEEMLVDFGAKDERRDPVIHLYEDFLAEFDPSRRAELGVFYTPQPIVQRIIDDVDRSLKEDFGLPLGVADGTTWEEVAQRLDIQIPKGADPREPFVSVLDPAAGTGTFLVQWIERAETNFRESLSADGLSVDEADLAWESHLENVVIPQMAGFEIDLASYAIAHLRLELCLPPRLRGHTRLPVFLTNTLGELNEASLNIDMDPITDESMRADEVKATKPVTVVIGNPPYRQWAGSDGGVVMSDQTPDGGPRLEDFEPTDAAHGGLKRHLQNLYVFFWRWALWKVFERSGAGVVGMVTSAAWLNGDVFSGMRTWLRDRASAISVYDLAGDMKTKTSGDEPVFAIQIPVAITVASSLVRSAKVHESYSRLVGTREDKFKSLLGGHINFEIVESETASGEVFGGSGDKLWSCLPSLVDIMPWNGQGMIASRTWVYAPDIETLQQRWKELIEEQRPKEKKILFKESKNANLILSRAGLPGYPHSLLSLEEESEVRPQVARVGYRAFDRQWVVADDRALHSPRPDQWASLSPQQIFAYELFKTPVQPGPSTVFSAHIPDVDFFQGNSNGRGYPLYRDNGAKNANLAPGLLSQISSRDDCGIPVTPEGFISYLAGLCSSPTFTQRFSDSLRTEGVRVPITKDPDLFKRVAEIGKKVISLQTYGERFSGAAEEELAEHLEHIQEVEPISTAPAPSPEKIQFDEDDGRLIVGDGIISGVSSQVWNYHVGTMQVIPKWFGYRRRDPAGRRSSPLDEIFPQWTEETTEELLALVRNLSAIVALEPLQAELLEEVLAGDLITVDELKAQGILPAPAAMKKPPKA